MKQLSLHVTDRCNFRCGFCVWGDTLHRGAEDLPRDELVDFLGEHRDGGFRQVNLHGGEPTLRRDLFELLSSIRTLGYPAVSIQTNGWALANRGFTNRLVDAGVRLVVLSVHGATPQVHDRLVEAPGSLQRLLAGMDHLRRLDVPVRTNTVVMRPNLAQLPLIADLVTAHGACQVNLSSLMPSGGAWPDDEERMPSYTEAAAPIAEAVRRAEVAGARVTLEGFPRCTVPGLEERCLHRDALSGDQIKCFVRGQVWDNHDSFLEDHCKSHGPACQLCRYEDVCPGVYTLYARSRGWSELRPISRITAAAAEGQPAVAAEGGRT